MRLSRSHLFSYLCSLVFTQFSYASIQYNMENCSFTDGNDLGVCYLNMTGEDLSQTGVTVIELAIYDDGSRNDFTFEIKHLQQARYVVIETSTAQMKKVRQTYLSYGLMCLGWNNPHPMPSCDIEMNHNHFGTIKVIQKNNNRYHC